MLKILEEEKIPEKWKIARILPLFKKGDMERNRKNSSICNLSSITKVYEKLLLYNFQEI
jgi:hypothetical protein